MLTRRKPVVKIFLQLVALDVSGVLNRNDRLLAIDGHDTIFWTLT